MLTLQLREIGGDLASEHDAAGDLSDPSPWLDSSIDLQHGLDVIELVPETVRDGAALPA